MIGEKSQWVDALLATLTFLLIAWTIFGAEEVLGYGLKTYGLRPREARGLIGIVSMHFLHGDIGHIARNSMSFLILNGFLFFFYRKIAWKVFLQVALIGGLLLWLWARPSNHIGASLLIYGEASFLFFSGIFRRDERMLRVSLVVAFVYGSIVWWVLPIDPSISWEGHLSGALIGIVAAYRYRGDGPKRKKYQWEIEEELLEQRRLDEEQSPTNTTLSQDYFYEFKPRLGTENVETEDVDDDGDEEQSKE